MFRLTLATILLIATAFAQPKLSPKWEELTAPDFIQAMQQSGGTCVLPIGILEKHGPHLPIGTDLINVRRAVLDAVQQEYAVVFPEYYFGQIFEARHQPGTIAYSLDLQLKLLQETTNEMARIGCKKVVIVNGHGGNESLLPLFGQAQLAARHDYVVFVFGLPRLEQPGRPPMQTQMDMHAGESETSHMMVSRPDLVHADRAASESGADQARLKDLPESVYTGIWWYARFPNHFSGDPASSNTALGQFDMKTWSSQIATAIKAIKADTKALALQTEFYDQTQNPLQTKQ
jgi:creatinine amidohydrolase